MPIYEYKGQQYDISTDDPAEAKQKILKHLGVAVATPPAESTSPARRETRWYEDIDAGVRNIIPRVTNAGLLALGGVGGLVGAEDFRDAMFEGYTERTDALQKRDETEGVNRGELGKIFQAVGEVPAYLSPTTAAGMIGAGALNTGGDLVKAGADAPHAIAGTMADAGSSAAMLALGPLANLSGRTSNALLQGGLNVAQEAGINHPVQNAIRESAGVADLPPMTAGDYGAAFVPGAAMGAAFTKPKAQQNKPDTDPSLTETKFPTVDELGSNFASHKKAIISSIGKQIEKLQLQQAELMRRGSMTEKQAKFYKALQEKIEFKEAEIRKESGILSKYESSKPNQTQEELAQAIQDVDILPANKERGSWTPFESTDPRQDDSDAPGVRPDSPDYAYSKDGLSGGRFDELRAKIRTEWNRGKNESVTDYEARIDKITEAALAKEQTRQANQPDETDLAKAGILRGFSKSEKRTTPPPKTVKTMEYELGKAKSFLAAIERRMLGEKKSSEGETVMGKQQEDTGTGRTVYTDKDGKKIVSFESDQGKANLLVDKIARLEEALAKAKRTENSLAAAGNEAAIRKTAVKGTGMFAPKDAADPQTDRQTSAFGSVSDQVYQAMKNRGMSETKARDAAWHFNPKNELGMWTPFASSRDSNSKRAKNIASYIDVARDIDVTTRMSSEELLQRVKKEGLDDSSGSTASKLEREFSGRGQFVEANKRSQPVVWEIAKILTAAKDTEIFNKRSWWSGNASKLAAKALGPFMKLSHYQDPETPEHIKIAATDKDKVSISEYMQLAQKEHVNHILRDSPNLSPEQRRVMDAYNSLTPFQQKGVKIFTKMLEQIRSVRGIPYLAGFIPHVRKGDFAVYIKTSKGDPAHLETFTSKRTADAWIKLAKEKGYDVSDVVDFKTPEGQTLAESFGLVRDILNSMNDRDPRVQAWVNKLLDESLEKVSSNPDIGRHREHYTGLSGFMGTKLFKTRLENANEFMKSMEDYASTSAAQHKKVQIIHEKNRFWDNPSGRKLRELLPNQAETADFMVDVAMNKDQKYGWTDSVDRFRDRIDDMFVKTRQNLRTKLGKDPDLLYYPDVPILDRVTGAGAQLFYISALTSRPGFWIGQALTSPFAIRQFLKEGTIVDTMAAQGKGWATVMTGGDAEWKAFVKDLANQSDSVHPQFINEINTLPGMSKLSSMHLDTLVQVLTGQRPAGMADAFSRYTVAAMAYHHYKQLGMKGDQLAPNVRRMVDDTMVMYDREHSPSVFNKMGLVGQNIAPLQKYGIAQLENLIGDLKFIAQKPEGMSTIRAMAPAISTLMTTMIMAGSIGLPLLMEYELLRAGFVGVSKFFGWDDVEDHVPPSVLEWMLTDDTILNTLVEAGVPEETAQTVENAATHGVLSAATGFDIGSSLRFNPYAPGADQNGAVSALSAFPIIKFMADMGDLALTQIRKHTAGDVTEAEDRASQLKMQFLIGQRAVVDATKFDANNRPFVPGGKRGYAQVEQTPQEQIGMVLGSKPLETSKQNAAVQIEQRREKKLALMKQKAVDLLVDGITHDNEKKIEKAYSMAVRAEMTPKQLKAQVAAAMHERNTPRWQDRFTNRKGQIKSNEQRRIFERAERYE